jgi:LPXTG-motif cell wall-anchored protein
MTALPLPAAAQLSDTRNAAEAQYPDMPTRQEQPSHTAAPPAPAAAAAPVEDDGGLPMTGFVAVPLLLVGALLLVTGGVMHVRTRDR